MPSYRFARRSFLASIGGAFGLHALLRNMEAAAAGAGAPPRFLMMHWPVGTIKQQFIPSGTGTSYTTSKTAFGPGYIVAPFDTPELRPHTSIMHGFNTDFDGYGGGHEDGTPFCTTGANSPGTRANGGETDDGCAGGPSWDQVFLKHVPGLANRNEEGTIIGRGYYNTICDRRIDSYETSTRCLSYGYEKVTINPALGPGGQIQENKPLLPQLSPLTAYNDLFSGFVPGGTMTDPQALKNLKLRKSVLDYSLRELDRLKTLGPSSEHTKIDAHAEAVRKLEAQLSSQIENGGGTGNECTVPTKPDSTVGGTSENDREDYDNPVATQADDVVHEKVGMTHAAIIRAAFTCDLIRVATFQWSPGTNHVSFPNLVPNDDTIWMHHPLSHKEGRKEFYDGANSGNYIYDAMTNANRWYFERTAKIVLDFLNQVDPLDPTGASLLENMVIPMVTEVADASHSRFGHGAVIFGGSRLGMKGGQYLSVSGNHNQIWSTVAQAFLGADAKDIIDADPANTYRKDGANPISALWAPV